MPPAQPHLDSLKRAVNRINAARDVRLSEDAKLELYGLFKVATLGPASGEDAAAVDASAGRSGSEADVEAHKRRAWVAATRRTGGDRVVAAREYAAIVDNLLGPDPAAVASSASSASSPPASAANAAETEVVVVEGPLLRLSGRNADTWVRRVFELRDDVLYFCDKRGDPPLGFLFLVDGFSVEVEEGEFSPPPNSAATVYPFSILHPRSPKRFTLAAQDAQDRERWVAALRAVSSNAARRAAAPASSSSSPPHQDAAAAAAAAAAHTQHTPRAPLLRSSSGRAKELYGVPTSFASLVDKIVEDFLARCDPNDEDTWYAYGEQRGVRMWALQPRATGNSAYVGVLGERVISASVGDVFDVVWQLGARRSVEPQLETVSLVEQLGPQTRVEHLAYSAVWPTNRRDFCRLVHWRDLDGGVRVVATTSYEHPLRPVLKDAVTAHILVSGFLLRPVGNSCRVTYVIIVDPRISGIPRRVVQSTSVLQALILDRIESYLVGRGGGGPGGGGGGGAGGEESPARAASPSTTTMGGGAAWGAPASAPFLATTATTTTTSPTPTPAATPLPASSSLSAATSPPTHTRFKRSNSARFVRTSDAGTTLASAADPLVVAGSTSSRAALEAVLVLVGVLVSFVVVAPEDARIALALLLASAVAVVRFRAEMDPPRFVRVSAEMTSRTNRSQEEVVQAVAKALDDEPYFCGRFVLPGSLWWRPLKPGKSVVAKLTFDTVAPRWTLWPAIHAAAVAPVQDAELVPHDAWTGACVLVWYSSTRVWMSADARAFRTVDARARLMALLQRVAGSLSVGGAAQAQVQDSSRGE